MPGVTDIFSGLLPSGNEITSSLSSILVWGSIFIIMFIVLVVGGVGIWFLIRRVQFNKKITIFEERNGVPEWFGEDTAREVVYNIYGDSIFFLRKRKKYMPRPERKVGKNRYFYVIRGDGTWINVGLGEIESRLKVMGVTPIHPDMRAFKSGMAKIIKDRFEKKNLLKEWAPIIVPIIFFIIVAIALYFIVDKIVASQDNLLKMTEASKAVMEKAGNVLSSLNNICSGSGIKTG